VWEFLEKLLVGVVGKVVEHRLSLGSRQKKWKSC
jgi:hypothetical protein